MIDIDNDNDIDNGFFCDNSKDEILGIWGGCYSNDRVME